MVLRGLILAVVTLSVAAGGASARTLGGTPVAFVSVEHASLLVGVDLATGRVIARIRVPAGPHNVTSYSARYVLVTSPPAGAVTLVDAFSRRIIKTWRGFGSPHDVEVEGGYAYVTDEARGQLAVIDLAQRKVVARVGVGPRPHDVAAADVALVTHGSGSPDLTMVDGRPRSPRVVGRVSAGGAAPRHLETARHSERLRHVLELGRGRRRRLGPRKGAVEAERRHPDPSRSVRLLPRPEALGHGPSNRGRACALEPVRARAAPTPRVSRGSPRCVRRRGLGGSGLPRR